MSDETFDYQDYRDRYAQHVMFYEAGVSNRDKVFSARVAVIGLGAIAIEAARLLAIARVGLLRFIHWEAGPADVAEADLQAAPGEYLPRGMGAVRALAEANRSLAVEVVNAAEFAKSTPANASAAFLPQQMQEPHLLETPFAADPGFEELLRDIDLVLYENGDSQRRTLVSETARRLKKPWIYAEARGGSGMTVSVIPGQTACIGCVKSQVAADGTGLNYAATVTDLIARTISQVQAMEALKILGESPSISTEIYCFDVDRFGHTLTVAKNEACPSCNA